MNVPVLFRDENLLAVDKPSGLAVHRGAARDRVFALQTVRDRVGRHVHAVHRLDRATSGVLLFALDPATARRMRERFEAGEVAKRYLALVRGIPPEAGVIDHPVPREEDGPRVPAVTEFRRLAVFERYSLVEARPLTGRRHQIRRHFKHLSHPLIGDVRYGKGEHNRLFRERFGLHRLALHALELAFPHPGTGEPLRITAPVPEDLAGPLRALGMDAHLVKIPIP
ncbi:MAG TPA: pseudouridine synthase [Thermoanaerobaculia bacterium]|jgi:tRNA pseudouridine65 synthase|nr:pseudouridine synthase [Thermoanaerobaculia bacterium]